MPRDPEVYQAYPYLPGDGPTAERPTPAEQIWCRATIRRCRREKLPFDEYPLILERGHSPYGGPSPAILAVDNGGNLVDLETVEELELAYVNDRRNRVENRPNTVSEMNESLHAMWEGDGALDWPNVCPDGTLPSSTRGPSIGRTTQEVGFAQTELFEAEPMPAAQPTTATDRGGKPRRKHR